MRTLAFGMVFAAIIQGVAVAQPTSFSEGLSDRQSYEAWFNSLGGDYKIGVLYWAGQRSQRPPGTCYGGPSQEWVRGCMDAKQRLDPLDKRRIAETDYRRGWNSYLPDASVSTSGQSSQPDLQSCHIIQSALQRLDCYDKLAASDNLPALQPSPSTAVRQAAEIDPEKCKKDWRSCRDTEDLVNNWGGISDAQVRCKIAAENSARFGTPKFPWLAFSSFLPQGGSAPKTGELTLVEPEAQYSNAFNAMVHSRAICDYDLKAGIVTNLAVIPN